MSIDLDMDPYSESDCELQLPTEVLEASILPYVNQNGPCLSYHVRSYSDTTASSFLPSSSSTQSIESDVSSVASSTSTNRNRYLFPELDTVEPLRPEEVRWLYKDKDDKKWTSFIGYDSLRIECKYQETIQRLRSKNSNEIDEDSERVIIRGGLYEVDVMKRKCYPIYWTQKDDSTSIMRGTWFFDNSVQPVDESYADQIEAEHLTKFEKQKLTEEDTEPSKGLAPVIHNIKFKEFHIDWNSMNKVYLHSETASSKFYRAVGTKLGLNKSGQRLRRGYREEAKMDDKPPDITNLIFVVHGIGQKMETGSIIKSCKDLRATCRKLKIKYFPDLDIDNKRVEFLPVEWRSSLRLDGDTVESITPNKVKGLRTMLNSSAMDILYYTSPLYRSEITQGLQTELNKLYEMFCSRHPYFEASGGKVSIVAHSLGCVITYDIITGWNPIQLYDQYVSNFIKTSTIVKNRIYFSLAHIDQKAILEKKCQQVENCSDLLSELEETRQRVSKIEQDILTLAEEQHLKTPTLGFKLENFFCLGSPLAVFLALRGIRPQGGTTQDHILPTSLCSRLYNIYHPSDPVAYRLEPLLIKEYANYKPVKIHRYDSSKKDDYDKIPLVPIGQRPIQIPTDKVTDDNTEVGEETDKEKIKETNNGDISSTDGVDKKWSKNTSGQGGWTFVFRRNKKNKESEVTLDTDIKDTTTDEDEMVKMTAADDRDVDKDVSMAEDDVPLDDDTVIINESDILEIEEKNKNKSNLEHRIDFQLKERKMENAYIAALTSHTSYWNQQDIALFIMTQIFPTYGPR